MRQYDIETEVLHWPLEKASPNVIEYINGRKLDLVINIPKNYQEEELTNDYMIRRAAADFGIPIITNMQLAKRFVEAVYLKRDDELHTRSWNDY
jgi:carbamoyl-phosphate synthase large subunit